MRIGIAPSFLFIAILTSVFFYPSFTISAETPDTVEEVIKSSPLSTEQDKKVLYGGCDGDPYEALRPYIASGQVVPKQVGNSLKDGLDPALACRLSKFFAYANQNGCPVKIKSGYRSESYQAQLCKNKCGSSSCPGACSRPGNSCHNYGLAVDVTTDCGGKLRVLAKQFKLIFPYGGPHIQCIEHPKPNRASCSGPCDGGIAISSDFSGISMPAAPSAGITDQIRQWFGQQAGGSPSLGSGQGGEQCTLPDGLTVPCSSIANPGGAQNGGQGGQQQQQSQPLPSSQQPFQEWPKAKPVSDIVLPTTQKNDDKSEEEKSLSVYERISIFAGVKKATSTATSAPLVLVVDGSNAVGIQDTSQPSVTPLEGEPVSHLSQPSQQTTFTSPDLGSKISGYVVAESTGYQQVLADMRAALEYALEYLRPFGRPATESDDHEFEEFSE